MSSKNESLSVLMSTYMCDNVDHLRKAFISLTQQTLKADEIILVEDGPISVENSALIEEFRDQLNITSIKLPQNVGLGIALMHGVLQCKSAIIARMDTDDIALPTRFAKQYELLVTHPEIAIVGGHIAEFDANPDQPLHVRKTKISHNEIIRAAWFRTPFNHMTVMFRKDAIIAAGNYRHIPGFEDYDLWVRLISSGYICHNLDDVLVLARVGNGLINRRSGWRYAINEFKAVYGFKKHGVIPLPALYLNIGSRLFLRILPKMLLRKVYQKLRSKL